MTNTQKEVKVAKKAERAPARKAAMETLKTVVIAVLITGIVAFVAGIHYQQNVDTTKSNAVNSAVKTAAQLKN
jgi:Tfp pilus assembly protein PilE